MRNKRFSVEQMIAGLKQAQVGCCCGGGDPQGRDQRTDFLSMEGYRRQHQTGWTGCIAQVFRQTDPSRRKCSAGGISSSFRRDVHI